MPYYNFHPVLLLRSPVYSYSSYSEKTLSEILRQPFFQKAIFFSSEVFYNELKKADFDIDKLEKKAKDTLKKYFNRMCFRPVPFGLCAAFGATKWGDKGSAIQFGSSGMHPDIQFSYAKSIGYANALLDTYHAELSYTLNSSIYKTGNEYRFLKQNRDNQQIEFVIDSVKTDLLFKKLLKYLQNSARTLEEISAFICDQANCTIEQAAPYVQWLIDGQIIGHPFEANITGEDHLKRVLSVAQNSGHDHTHPIFDRISSIHDLADLDHFADDDLKSNDLYVNLNIKLPNGLLDARYQRDIIDGIKCLDHFNTAQQPAGLADFVKRYTQKFEGRTVPLLTAIDPEIGVGYSDLAVEEDDINIAKNIANLQVPNTKPFIWTNAHTMLLNKWNASGSANAVITLTDDDLQSVKKDNESVAPTTSVIFRILGDKVLIESAGGACSSALIGRFTPFDTEIERSAIEMAKKESLYNPDIIFAEIAHICHDHTANIDRRKHIYPYEIPVLVTSTLPPRQQILLNDLWLSVINGQVILTSKKHGKRVIPRLSSAFNYTRNDLAVFRFLCDLQKAYVKTTFSLNLDQLFPGLDHYPRVEYKNTILHLACWNLKKETFAHALNADINNRYHLFKIAAHKLALPRYIALTEHDHQLVFDLNKADDAHFFLDTVNTQKKTFMVKEYLLPPDEAKVVVNEKGEPHVNQFIAALYHDRPVYKPFTPSIPNNKTQRKFIPGSEWLYVKLYCHPIRSNELITGPVRNALKKLSKSKLTDNWFFIRYNQPSYHIRLRLHIDPKNYQEVSDILYQTIMPHTDTGTISNYTVTTYERELERYSAVFINDFEYTFYTSSDLVSAFLKQVGSNVSAAHILGFAMVSATDMMVALGLEDTDAISFTQQIFNSFASEFSRINNLRYQLDVEYRKQQSLIDEVMRNTERYYSDLKLNGQRAIFINSLSRLRQITTYKGEWKNKWISDLVHMHLNRLFVDDPRKQEMMVYYFLNKHQRSVQARHANKL